MNQVKKKIMKPIRRLSLLSFLVALSVSCAWSASAAPDEYFVYFGTYTGFTYMNEGLPAGGSHSKGIYVSRFQPATGAVNKPELAAEKFAMRGVERAIAQAMITPGKSDNAGFARGQDCGLKSRFYGLEI